MKLGYSHIKKYVNTWKAMCYKTKSHNNKNGSKRLIDNGVDVEFEDESCDGEISALNITPVNFKANVIISGKFILRQTRWPDVLNHIPCKHLTRNLQLEWQKKEHVNVSIVLG